jgi:polyhydroxyalkanoate synthesis regulator phasin
MPVYQITAPNGRTYRIEGPPGASDADVAQAVLAQFPEAGKPPAESTVLGEIVRGGKQLASSVRTGLGSLTAPEEAALAGLERGEKIAAEAGEGPSFAAVRKAYEERGFLPAAGEVASQIPRAVAGQLPQLAAMAGGARLGAMAGAGIGSIVPVVGTGAGALVGGVLGAGATLLPQFMGANVERQAKEQLERGEPISIDRTKAYGAAAGQAAVESAGTAFVLGKRVVKGVLGITDDAALTTAKAQQELVKTAQRSLAASAGRGALRGTAEIPVEIAQAVIERAQAGLDLTSPEAMEEYGENAYLAGLVGPTIGSAANVVERRGAQRALAATAPPVEAPIERAERLKAEKAAAETPPPAPPVTETPAPPPVAETPAPPPVAETPAPPPVAETPAPPPVAETPAPPVEEPKVRKPGEPPATGLQPADIEALGISKKQPIYRRMLGKDLENPEQRAEVLADIENYLVRGNGTEESRAKLTEFKAKFAPPPAAEAAPTPPAAEAAVPPTPPAPAREDYWRPNPAEPENKNSWQDTFGFIHYDVNYPLPKGGRVKDLVEATQSNEIQVVFENSKGEEKILSVYAAKGKKPYWRGAGDMAEAQIETGLGSELYNAIGDKALETEAELDALVAKIRGILSKPTETPSVAEPQPEAGGAGVPVAGGPAAVTPTEGVGPEPDGVVPPVTDVAEPAGGKAAEPTPVTPPTPAQPAAPTPAQVERELATLVESGRITEEQAADYRAELLGEAEEAPTTAMGQAFQKQVDSLKAQMDALRQKSGKKPAPKSKNRAKFDALEAQLQTLVPKATGNLAERIELLGLSSVIGKAPYPGAAQEGSRVALDIDLLKENLLKAKATPRMTEAILNYIGVDADGNYLPTVYSREEAAEMAGLSAATGSEVSRAAEAMGITLDVRSRFHAGQTELGVGAAKNASEEGTGATDLNPRRGALYAPKKKGPPTVAPFLRGALAPDGMLDFSEVPLESAKAKGDKPAVVGLAEMFVRASQFNRKNYQNDNVINALQAEVDRRIKLDRKKTNDAITRAYGKFTETEDVSSNQKALELQIEKGLKSGKLTPVGDIADLKAPQLAALIADGKAEIDTKLGTIRPIQKEAAALDQTLTEEEAAEAELRAEETEVEDRTARLSDEDVNYRTIPQSPVVTNRASHAELEKVVSDIGKALGGEVSVTILDDVTDVDAKQQPGTRAGALIKGQIYLFRSGIAKGIEGQKTVFHELFHKGLENLLPEAEYRAMMSRFYNQSAEVRRMADAYLASDTGKKDTEGMSPQEARVLAVEESLAEVAEQTKLKPTLVRQVGNFLARVADRFGMPQLARAIRTMGLNEQQKFIQDALQAGLGPSAGEGATRFRTVTPQTEAAVQGIDVIGEQDKRTFGQRVARELKGNPALRLREKFTDSLAPLEDLFVNAYGGATRTAKGRLNPMVLLSRALDALRVSKAAQEIGGLGREDGLIIAKALPVNYKDTLKRIADAAKERGQTYEEFRKTVDTVLYAHREYNLREKNKTLPQDEQIELLLKDHQIDRLEAAFQQDDFIKGISTDLDTIRFNLLDTLVDTGRISAEQAKDYRDAIGYIPFERIGEYENQWNNATRGANRGVAALKKMRSLEGSDRKSTSVVENFSGLMDWATKEAMKNEAALRALKDMELLGAAVKRPTEPKTDAPGDTVDVFDGGKKVSYYIPDPAHLVAFSIADPQLSKILKAFQRGSQVLRAGVTAMPPFAIKQVFDDVIRAYTYAGVKNNGELVKNVLFNFPKNWVNEVMRRESKGVRELKNLGIVGTFDFTQQTNLKDILEEAGAKKERIGSAIIRVMEAGAKASDLAVREAIYKQVLKETGDKAQAESAAREIINFSRRGSSKMMGQMISIIPFFNAYARGMDKLATAAAGRVVGQSTGTARSMFYQRMGVLTSMGLLYALMMQDDEEYNKLPDHVRDTNWVLPYGKELGFTPVIPIPAELAFFFKAIPERIVRYYKYQGTEEEQAAMSVLGELTKRGIDVFSSPNVTPQVLRPFLENIVNYSFFLGRPLESQAQLQLRPFERYGTGTSDAMKAVARGLEDVANATGIEAFAVSPIKLENAVRGLMGTAAGLTLSMADMMVNPNRTDRPLHQQLTPQLTGASAVMKTAVGTRYMDEIYDLEKRVEQVNGTYNRLMKTQPEKVEEYLKDNIGMYSIREPVKSIMDAIRTLNEAAMTIDRDTSLSPEERRKLIDELRVEQNDIARVVFSLRKQARDIQAGL